MLSSAPCRLIRLDIAKLREKRKRLRWQIGARREPKQWSRSFDDLAGDRPRVPSGGTIAGCFRQSLRLVQESQKKIFGFIGGHDRHECREDLILRIMAVDDLIRGPCLAANEVALDIDYFGGAYFRVEPHQITQGLRRFRLDDPRRILSRILFVPLQEGWRDEKSAIRQSADGHHGLQGSNI